MKYRCPYCRNEIKNGFYCSECNHKIEPFRKVWEKSAFYYNKGLEAARRKELSLAVTYLKKAVTLYHYNIEARNLLGLVYFETGLLGNALKEWIMSQSLQKEDNLATYYIESIHKQPKYLAANREAIILYNKARSYLLQQNIDMAVIRLKKAVSLQPNLVEARALLALSFIELKQYYKANEQVKKILSVDESHEKALAYFRILSGENTDTVEPFELEYKQKDSTHTNIHKLLDRSASYRRAAISFAVGVLAVVLIGKYLILPNEVNKYIAENKRIEDERDELSREIQIVTSDYETKLNDLQSQKDKLDKEVEDYKNQVTTISQKEKLRTAQNQYYEREYVEAAKSIFSVATSSLDEVDLETYNELKEEVYPRAANNLYNEGIYQYNQGNYSEAVTALETILIYEPEDRLARKSLYYLAMSYEKTENIEMAKKYYNEIITNYPDTNEYYNAQNHLDKFNDV